MPSWKKRVESLRDAAGLPSMFAAGLPEIRLSEFRSVSLSAHRGLRAYSQDCVVVGLQEGELEIRGAGLQLSLMTMEELHIRGTISALERRP